MTPPPSSCLQEGTMCEVNRTADANKPHLVPLVVVLSSISLVTVGLNLLVLYAVRTEKKLHTVGNLYIVSLSVADLIVGAAVMPLNIVYLFKPLKRPLCLFWLSMDYVASTASIFSVFILCIDRYRSVQQPLKYLRYRTKTRATVTILITWFLASLWIIPILGWKRFWSGNDQSKLSNDSDTGDKCETDFYKVTWFKVMTAIINFYLPTLLMLFFYSKIYRAVRQHCQHRELINGSFPSFSGGTVDHRKHKICLPKPEKNARLEPLKRKPEGSYYHVSSNTSMKTQDPAMELPPEKNTPKSSEEEDEEVMVEEHFFPTDIVQTQDGTEEARRYISIHQNQPEPKELLPATQCASETSEETICAEAPSRSRDSSAATDLATSMSAEDQAKDKATFGLDYLTFTWKRFRSHSRQYIKGLHMNRERKAAKQLGCIMAAFILCWIPYFIFFMVIAYCAKCCNDHVQMFTMWLGYINSTLNPLIYPLCNENFKKAFKKIFRIGS
ncbi:histamine H1 receptor [Monodelphis domestica]|uniref:histamine H1 receptor n=1 Tax=Monodelphis domestica TaxID=13616 RepID=UPI0024E268B9|nr:histamine H1 receptor [Monodelphis domestica]XP_056660639.1 histamine H1 receptor [Monodelphis domestica]